MEKTRIVTCRTEGCGNKDADIELPDNGTMVICGVCHAVLLEEDPERAAAFIRSVIEREFEGSIMEVPETNV